MRLLIPTTDAAGATAQLSGQFGKAPFNSVADTETGAILTVANPSVESSQGHHGCVPASEAFGDGGFDAVICQGIGRGALHQLTQAGVPVFVHDGPDVSAALEGFRSRTIRLANDGDGCGGGSGSCGCHGHN
jgi:predicted Fe-Mo cluster-binding NifX family protein